MKKGLAIKITSGILVIALVAVIALALAGVFSGKKVNDAVVVNAEDASVNNVATFRNISTDKVFYISSSKSITDINTYVGIKSNDDAILKISDKKDENGNVGFTAKGGWKAGVTYNVYLKSGDVAFAEEQFKDMTSFMFIVDAPEAYDCTLNANVVNISKDDIVVFDAIGTDANGVANKWEISIKNVDAKFADNVVFVISEKLDVKNIKEDGELSEYAVKRDMNVEPTYDSANKIYTATVVNANVDDVFEELNVHTNVNIDEENFIFDEEATVKSIMTSDMFLSTVKYLYGEQLGSKNFNLGDYCKLTFDYDFKKGTPCYVTLDATLSFSGFLKSAKNASVSIKIANVLTPEFHGNFQKDPIAFDASLDLAVDTTVTVSGEFAYNFDNTDADNNTDANVALKNIVNKVSALVADALNNEQDSEKSFIFATWVIPVGTTPIQIVEKMGIEVKADLKARLGASMKNKFNVEVGVAYCDSNVCPIFNVKDDFEIGTITLWGTVETKVGLYNEIGITACGVISVDLGVSVGAYCDIAGRLEMSGWDIVNKQMNIEPAYYIEAGIYLDMDISGKVLIFNIKKQNILSKKWPLWSSGYKYIPEVETLNYAELTADEDYYMNSGYFFFTTFKAYSIDIQNISDVGSVREINWDEFDYTLDKNYLTMVDNKVRVVASAPNKFETDIVVTSKVNKGWKKVIHVIKTPEAPTANNPEKRYEKGSNSELNYAVRLNSSKFIGLKSSEINVTSGDYTYEDNTLTLKPKFLESLNYGNYTLLFESSKGYCQLYLEVYSDKDIVPAQGFGTVVFDKGEPKNAEFEIDLVGNSIVSISTFEASEWVYSASTGKLKILASALLEEEVGTQIYGIEFSNGEKANLYVKVEDNRLPKLNTKAYEYVLGSAADLELDVTLYGNTITEIVINNGSINQSAFAYLGKDGKSIVANYFDTYRKAATLEGYFIAKNTKYNFTIELGVDNMIILPVKYVEYDKNSAKDLALYASIPEGAGKVECANATLKTKVGENFSVNAEGIVIKAGYLANLESGLYTFQLNSNADNAPTFMVNVSNSTAPTVDTSDIKINKGAVASYSVKWDLIEYTTDDVTVEGLNDAQYTKTEKALVLNVEELAYGETVFTVVTPVNAFDVKVVVDGTARWTQKSYTFRVADGQALNLYTDLANSKLYDIKFVKDGKEAEIYNTQFRNDNGTITLSNDFAYNLEAGKYTVSIYVDDGEKLAEDATVTVVGKLETIDFSAGGNKGSKSNPYEIYTKAQLKNFIAQNNTFTNVYFKLMADIDLQNETIDPIGKKSAAFNGNFDGNGYTISNFKITDVNNDYTGLFAYNKGTVKDLRLSGVTVDVSKAGSVGIGLVVGHNEGVVEKVYVVNGKINAVSKSWLDIKNAYFDIGGLVGYNDGGTIKKCDCEIEINAEVKGLSVAGINIGGRKSCINVGAVVGYFKSGSVVRCNVTADINAKAHNDNVTSNGWYGNTELSEEELAESETRCKVTIK